MNKLQNSSTMVDSPWPISQTKTGEGKTNWIRQTNSQNLAKAS